MDTNTQVIEQLRQHSRYLSQLLSETRMDAMEYAYVLQTIMNVQQEIRSLRIEDRYQNKTNKTPTLYSND